MGLWAELKRRRVVRVGAVYLIVAWLVLQVVNNVAAPLALPPWTASLVLVLLGVGLPVALVIAWAFELTPEGIKRSAPVAGDAQAGRLAVTDVALLIAVVALTGVSLLQISRAPATPATPSAAPSAAPASASALSVAVLPFSDLSPEGDQEYFSDGLSEELLNALAQIPELRVAGRTSSFAFKGRNADLREIGEQLGVANILEGSVRKSGDRLRITAQLINAGDGYHLWSQTYDRELDDVFAVQEEIARAVAAALSITLGVSEPAGAAPAQTADVELYDLYLRGLALVRNSPSPEGYLRAADIFRGILALEPGFARARVTLASTYMPIVTLFPERAAQSVAELEAVVADAFERMPDASETHYANAILQFQRRNWLAAEAAFGKVGGASGIVTSAVSPAVLRLSVGRAAEAADELAAAARNDPLAQDVTNILQQALMAAGRFDEAEIEYRRSVELGLAIPPIQHMALMRVWNGDDAALTRQRLDRYIGAQTVQSPLDASVRGVFDDPAAALARVRAAADRPDMQDATRQMLVAMYAAYYGDPELVVATMRRSLVDMNGPFTHLLWLPDLADARGTAAFKDLAHDVGLVDYWRASGNWGDFCRPLGSDDFECF